MYGDRTGMRTFATTDVAYGQKLSDLKLVFEYHNTLGRLSHHQLLRDGWDTLWHLCPDLFRHRGPWASSTPLNGWSRMTIDLTRADISTTAVMAVYEHNGLSTTYGDPYTGFQWPDIKNLTIAGWYDYQRSPTDGWGALEFQLQFHSRPGPDLGRHRQQQQFLRVTGSGDSERDSVLRSKRICRHV